MGQRRYTLPSWQHSSGSHAETVSIAHARRRSVSHDGTWNTDDLSIGESSTHDEEAKMISGVQKSEEMKKRRALC
jgi:hypothetical protein